MYKSIQQINTFHKKISSLKHLHILTYTICKKKFNILLHKEIHNELNFTTFSQQQNPNLKKSQKYNTLTNMYDFNSRPNYIEINN